MIFVTGLFKAATAEQCEVFGGEFEQPIRVFTFSYFIVDRPKAGGTGGAGDVKRTGISNQAN